MKSLVVHFNRIYVASVLQSPEVQVDSSVRVTSNIDSSVQTWAAVRTSYFCGSFQLPLAQTWKEMLCPDFFSVDWREVLERKCE